MTFLLTDEGRRVYFGTQTVTDIIDGYEDEDGYLHVRGAELLIQGADANLITAGSTYLFESGEFERA